MIHPLFRERRPKHRLISEHALTALETAINRVTGGAQPPEWDINAAQLDTEHDWMCLQAAALLGRLPEVPTLPELREALEKRQQKSA